MTLVLDLLHDAGLEPQEAQEAAEWFATDPRDHSHDSAPPRERAPETT